MFDTQPLGDLIDFFNGKAIKPGGTGQYPVYGSNGLIGGSDEYRYENAIIIGRVGAYCGSIAYCPTRFWASDNTIVVRQRSPSGDVRYLAYLLQFLELNRHAGGAAQPLVTQTTLRQVMAPVAPEPTQCRIAFILSSYDDLIENNTRRIAVLEEMARRLYEEWFVHFRFPGHEQVRMVESEFGLIPEGWLENFASHVDFLEGPGLRNWQYRPEGIPFLNIRTLVANDIDLNKVQFVDPDEVQQKYKHFLLDAYDHVVSSSGTLGRIVTIRPEHLPLMLNTSIIRMKPKGDRIGRWLLKGFLRSDYYQNQINSVATGAAQKNYGPSHLKEMWIIAPPASIGMAFEKQASPIEQLILKLVRKNINLRAQRDLLLPKLISGEIDVSAFPEAEAIAA